MYNFCVINKVVVRYLDGKVIRGSTADFHPDRDVFHVTVTTAESTKSVEVKLKDLKAVFFVKELLGLDKHRTKKKTTFEEMKDKKLIGKKVKVEFIDGEILCGLTMGYSPQRKGFFFNPIDPDTNNERIFAIMKAVKEVTVYE